jgi:hypothetical protein
MRLTLLLVLLTSSTAAAQERRVYTNADLVNGPVKWTHAVTQDELRSLEANQFRLPAQYPNGPDVVGVRSSPTAGPYGEFPKYESRRLYGGLDYYWPGSYGYGRHIGAVRSYSVRPLLAPRLPVATPRTGRR